MTTENAESTENGEEAVPGGVEGSLVLTPVERYLAAIAAQHARNRVKWSEEHDDGHARGELADAAAVYAAADGCCQQLWPWDLDNLPPKCGVALGFRRKQLIHACALALAELERLDRAHPHMPNAILEGLL